jgi:hypothetical protein
MKILSMLIPAGRGGRSRSWMMGRWVGRRCSFHLGMCSDLCTRGVGRYVPLRLSPAFCFRRVHHFVVFCLGSESLRPTLCIVVHHRRNLGIRSCLTHNGKPQSGDGQVCRVPALANVESIYAHEIELVKLENSTYLIELRHFARLED